MSEFKEELIRIIITNIVVGSIIGTWFLLKHNYIYYAWTMACAVLYIFWYVVDKRQ